LGVPILGKCPSHSATIHHLIALLAISIPNYLLLLGDKIPLKVYVLDLHILMPDKNVGLYYKKESFSATDLFGF